MDGTWELWGSFKGNRNIKYKYAFILRHMRRFKQLRCILTENRKYGTKAEGAKVAFQTMQRIKKRLENIVSQEREE